MFGILCNCLESQPKGRSPKEGTPSEVAQQICNLGGAWGNSSSFPQESGKSLFFLDKAAPHIVLACLKIGEPSRTKGCFLCVPFNTCPTTLLTFQHIEVYGRPLEEPGKKWEYGRSRDGVGIVSIVGHHEP